MEKEEGEMVGSEEEKKREEDTEMYRDTSFYSDLRISRPI